MNIRGTTKLVEDILRTSEMSRNSDTYLYIKVVERLAPDAAGKPFNYVFNHLNELGIPKPETVRRSRQKLQEKYSELRGNDEVTAGRMVLEEEYREYARS